ncbi:MAG: hypothetical protein GC157_10820 [Frankiales bacterium]|nr:hypothetical protein [Frankiales bacterium]
MARSAYGAPGRRYASHDRARGGRRGGRRRGARGVRGGPGLSRAPGRRRCRPGSPPRPRAGG